MTEIRIKSTDRTPSIIFNPATGYICFEGKAIPENAIQYFRPIVDGFTEFVKDPAPNVQIDVKLIYINTSSLNILLDMIKQFEEPVREGRTQVTVTWYCDADDTDMIDCANDAGGYFSEFNYEVVLLHED